MAPVLTVHTPTWNRADTLQTVWDCLNQQDFDDFEWIVTDDASDDHTMNLLERWMDEATFDMQIRHYSERAGKPASDNAAVRNARGKYFVTADSDDAFVPHALRTFVEAWDGIPDAERDSYCIITAQSVCNDGTPVGRPFPASPFDTTPFDLAYKHRLHFDSWHCYSTKIMRANPYPEVDYVVPESVIWLHAVGQDYRIRCFNEVLRIMDRTTSNSITQFPKMRYNRGYACGRAHELNNQDAPLHRRTSSLVRAHVNYGRLARHGGLTWRRAMRELERPAVRAMFTATYPAAFAVSISDQIRGKVDRQQFTRATRRPKVQANFELLRSTTSS